MPAEVVRHVIDLHLSTQYFCFFNPKHAAVLLARMVSLLSPEPPSQAREQQDECVLRG